LNNVKASGLHTVREQILFTYSGIATNDSELTRIISEGRARGVPPKVAVQEAGYRPNLKKRGSLRSIYDGRYKFTRYFAPVERNTPKTLKELRHWNDLELFDLHADPLEKTNLAGAADSDLLLSLNSKLNSVMAAEFGADDGREMPDFKGIDWAVSSIDL
jgi:arylsulfatase